MTAKAKIPLRQLARSVNSRAAVWALEALLLDTFATAKVNTKIVRIYGEGG